MGLFGNGYQRGGLHLTWIIGLLIAGYGLFKFATNKQVNPVTGQAQHVALSPKEEIALGLQAAPQMAQQMGGEVDASDPRTQLVKRIGEQLVRQIDAPNMPWQFDFHLLRDDKTVNAFALPGGQVFITTALLYRLQNEAQLVGVLGHEIGHVIERHSAEHMAKGELGQALSTAVVVGSSDSNGRGRMAGYAAVLANNMLQLKYGRDDELESDGYGVRYMTRAGFDPNEMIEVMRILKEASGGRGGPEFTSTHPDPGNRADEIRKQVKQHFPDGVPPNLTKGRPMREAVGSAGGGGWGADDGWGTPPAKPKPKSSNDRW